MLWHKDDLMNSKADNFSNSNISPANAGNTILKLN